MPWGIPDVHTDVTWGQWDLNMDTLRLAAGTGGYLISLSGSTRSLHANSPCVQSDNPRPRLGLRTTTIWAGLVKVWIQQLEALRWNMKTSHLQPHGFSPQLSSNGSRWQLSFWLFLIIPCFHHSRFVPLNKFMWFFKINILMQKLLLSKLQHNEFIHTGRRLAFTFFPRNRVKLSHCFLVTTPVDPSVSY